MTCFPWDTGDLFYPLALSRLVRHAWDTADLFYPRYLSRLVWHAFPGIQEAYFIPWPLVASYNMPEIQWTYSTPMPLVASYDMPVADPGGGGPGGPDPPLLGHDVGFLTLGPKLDPPLLWMSKSGGVFQFFWGRMTSRGQCPRGGCACECPRVGVFFKFSEVGWRHMDNVQGGGVLVKNPVSAPGPPPFQKSWIRACMPGIQWAYSIPRPTQWKEHRTWIFKSNRPYTSLSDSDLIGQGMQTWQWTTDDVTCHLLLPLGHPAQFLSYSLYMLESLTSRWKDWNKSCAKNT